MTGLGRPRQGRGIKISTSVRVEENVLKKIKRKYGSLQKYLDKKLQDDEVKNENKK